LKKFLTMSSKSVPARPRGSKTIIHRKFNSSYATIKKDDPGRDYQQMDDASSRARFKWGQLKVALGEILWLCNAWDRKLYPKIILVVAGGASGQHYQALSEMFPDIAEIHLYDKNHFGVQAHSDENPNRIKLFHQFFLEADAQKYAGRNDVFFACDIRSISHKGSEYKAGSEAEREADVWTDHLLQMSLLEIMNPISALLKLRLPYYKPSDPKRPLEVEYLSGRIYTQCFSGRASSETRLEPERIVGEDGKVSWRKIRYSVRDYERKLFRYNSEVRIDWRVKDSYGLPVQTIWHNHLTNTAGVPDEGELIDCFDSMYLIYILDMYLHFVGDSDMSNPRARLGRVMVVWNWLRDITNELLSEKEKLRLGSLRAAVRAAMNAKTEEPEPDFFSEKPTEMAVPTVGPSSSSSSRSSNVRLPRTPGSGFADF